jgi:hypothetical protein
MKRLTAMIVALLGLAGCGPLPGPERELAIQVNDLCTTCVDFLRCEADGPAGDSLTLYVLEQKSFMAQIATIWQYLVQYVNPRKTDQRGVTVWTRSGQGPATSSTGQAEQDLVTFEIRLPGARVDQYTGAWYGAGDTRLGNCRTLTRAEGRDLLNSLRGSQ